MKLLPFVALLNYQVFHSKFSSFFSVFLLLLLKITKHRETNVFYLVCIGYERKMFVRLSKEANERISLNSGIKMERKTEREEERSGNGVLNKVNVCEKKLLIFNYCILVRGCVCVCVCV